MDLFEEYRIADAAKVLQSSNLSGKAPIFSLKKFEWDKKGANRQQKIRTMDEHALFRTFVSAIILLLLLQLMDAYCVGMQWMQVENRSVLKLFPVLV